MKRKENKYYNLRDAMIEYSIQDIDDPIKNKNYCIVKRGMVLDYVEFRNLLIEYGIVKEEDTKKFDFQEIVKKED